MSARTYCHKLEGGEGQPRPVLNTSKEKKEKNKKKKKTGLGENHIQHCRRPAGTYERTKKTKPSATKKFQEKRHRKKSGRNAKKA